MTSRPPSLGQRTNRGRRSRCTTSRASRTDLYTVSRRVTRYCPAADTASATALTLSPTVDGRTEARSHPLGLLTGAPASTPALTSEGILRSTGRLAGADTVVDGDADADGGGDGAADRSCVAPVQPLSSSAGSMISAPRRQSPIRAFYPFRARW